MQIQILWSIYFGKVCRTKCTQQRQRHYLLLLPWAMQCHIGVYLFVVASPKEANTGNAALTIAGIFCRKLCQCKCSFKFNLISVFFFLHKIKIFGNPFFLPEGTDSPVGFCGSQLPQIL